MSRQASAPVEHVLRISGEHWVRYVLPVFVYILLMAISILLFLLAGATMFHSVWISHISFVTALLLMLGAHHAFFGFLLSEATEHIVVTDKRIIHMNTRLFLEDEMFEVSYDKMKTVEGRKDGFLQNVLRYGSLRFESGARVNYVPHPGLFVKDIEQAMGRR